MAESNKAAAETTKEAKKKAAAETKKAKKRVSASCIWIRMQLMPHSFSYTCC